MLSKIPLEVKSTFTDLEILRVGMIAELDAINLYEQMAACTNNKNLRSVLLDVAKEEKTHLGEFESLLLELDTEQADELAAGKKEVDNNTN